MSETINFTISADSSEGVAAVERFTSALKGMSEKAGDETEKAAGHAGHLHSALESVAEMAAAVGIGFEGMKLAEVLEEAVASVVNFQRGMFELRITTGETGQALTELTEQMEKVFDAVPDSMENVSRTMASLHSRLELTGEPLEALTTQILNLSRKTGTDLTENVRSAGASFVSWGVQTAQMGDKLDFVFRVFQKTNTPVTVLLQSLALFGPQLRGMGFSFEEAAVLIGKLEQAGLPTSRMMMGLTAGIANFSKHGEEAPAALQRLIESIKNAGSAAAANSIAIEVFKGRSGVAFAEAIRAGRLELVDMVKELKEHGDTINKAAEDTKTFSEKMTEAWHKVESAIVNGGDAIGKLRGVITDFAGKGADFVLWLSKAEDLVNGLKLAVTGFAAVKITDWGISAIGTFADKLPAMGKALGNLVSQFFVAGTAITAFGAATAILIGYEVGTWIGQWIRGLPGVAATVDDVVERLRIFEHTMDNIKFKQDAGKNLDAAMQAMIIRFPEMESKIKAAAAAGDIQLAAMLGKIQDEMGPAGVAAHNLALQVGSLEYVLKSKNITVDRGTMSLDKYRDAMLRALYGERTLSPEQQKTKDQLDDTIKPLDKLVASYEQFHAVGMTTNQWLTIHATELVEAAETQRKFGVAIPPSADALLALAVSMRRANETFDDARLKIPDAGAEIRQLGIDALAGKKDLDAALDNLTTQKFGDAFHDLQPGVRDYLTSQVSSASEIEKNWKHTNDMMATGAKKAAADSANAWKHGMHQISTATDDFAKGIVDIIMGKGGNIIDAFKQLARGMLRSLVEVFFSPINMMMKNFAGQLMGLFSGKSFNFGSIFSGLSFPGFGGGGGLSVTNMAGGTMSGTPSLAGGGAAAGGGLSTGMAGGIGAMAGFGAGWGIDKLSGGGTLGKISGVAGGAFAGLTTAALLNPAILMPLIGALGPIGVAVLGAALAVTAVIGPLVKAFQGKNAYEAGSPEVTRDFGGLQTSKKDVQGLFDSLHLSESDAYPIRKDIFSSPKAVTEFLWPLAQAQGKTDQFLQSLEKVQTSWGTFDFRKPFEEGLKSGDFQALNDAFEKAWGPEHLGNLGKFKDEWKAVASGVDKTTDALGRNAEEVQKDLTAFNGLVEKFKQTAVLTPELSDMIMKFGGNLRAFQDAAALPGLQEMKTGFEGIRQSLEEVLPNMYAEFQKTGLVTDEFAAKIRAAGGDVAAFEKFGQLKHGADSLDEMVSKFKSTGVASKELIDLLAQFAPGFDKGARLTSKNIDALAAAAKSNLGNALKGAAGDLKTDLDKIDETLTKSIDRLTQNLTFAIENLVAAIQGNPLPHDLSASARTTGTGTSTGTGTGTGTGGDRRGNSPPGLRTVQGGEQADGLTIVFQGDVFGMDHLEDRIAKAVRDAYRRGSLRFLGSN